MSHTQEAEYRARYFTASFTFFPLYFAPSVTVLPTPLPVSLTPSPILPSGIFFAPLSTWRVPAFTFESSAASATPDASSESESMHTMTSLRRFIKVFFLGGTKRSVTCDRVLDG